MPDPTHDTVLEATGATARLARVYAEALMAAAGPGQVDAVGEELAGVVQSVTARPGVFAFLASGAVSKKAKFPVLAAAFNTTASEVVQKFLGVLTQNNRLALLPAISATYQQLRDEAAGRVRVTVTSAVPLSDAQLGELKSALAGNLKAEPVLRTRTDPDLLGGLVVQVGDRVYDTSVRTRLDTLRSHLMTSGSHGA
jgi:F-type H+-transporting ATPase subunit delta